MRVGLNKSLYESCFDFPCSWLNKDESWSMRVGESWQTRVCIRVVLIFLAPGQTKMKVDESWWKWAEKSLSKSCFDFPCSWSNKDESWWELAKVGDSELMRVDRQEFVWKLLWPSLHLVKQGWEWMKVGGQEFVWKLFWLSLLLVKQGWKLIDKSLYESCFDFPYFRSNKDESWWKLIDKSLYESCFDSLSWLSLLLYTCYLNTFTTRLLLLTACRADCVTCSCQLTCAATTFLYRVSVAFTSSSRLNLAPFCCMKVVRWGFPVLTGDPAYDPSECRKGWFTKGVGHVYHDILNRAT